MGKGAGDSYDKAYNQGLLELQKEQQDWAGEYMDYWRDVEQPYSTATTEANTSLLPDQVAAERAGLGVTTNTAATTTDATNAMNTLATDKANMSSNMLPEYREALTDAADIEGGVRRAGADVTQAFDNSAKIREQDFSRLGVKPTDGAYQDKSLGINRAIAESTAKTNARTLGKGNRVKYLGMGVR